MAKYIKKALGFTFLASLLLVFPIGTAKAEKAMKVMPSPVAAAKEIKFSVEKVRDINPETGPDLVCEIKAFYDQEMHQPIEDNTWILSGSHQNPPWIIWHRLIVMNNGSVAANNFQTSVQWVRPKSEDSVAGSFQTTENIGPHEALVVVPHLPFTVDSMDPTGFAAIIAHPDGGYDVAEVHEDNNVCSFVVYFRNP